MKLRLKKKFKFKKLFVVLMSLILLMPILGGLAPSKTVQASDDPSSMEDVAKNMSKYGSKFATDKKNYKYFDSIGNDWNYFGPGNNSILNPSAKGENNASYNALYSGLYNTQDHSMYYAARYAYAMNQAGLDHQSDSDQNPMHKVARVLGGWIVIILLDVNVVVNKILGFAYSIFRWINPFCAIQYLATNQSIAHGSIWKPVFDMIRPLYWALGKISWVLAIMAFMGGITFALAGYKINSDSHGGLSLQSGGRQTFGALGSNIASVCWKFLKRAIVFLIGPILIGVLSNAFLTDIQTDTNLSDTVALQQIYGNYVDFGDWADYSRLALPTHTGNAHANILDPSGTTEFSSDYINKINADGANESTARIASNGGNSADSKKVRARYLPHISTDKTVAAAQNFMHQYTSNASYTSSDWESRVKSKFRVQASQAPKSKTSSFAKTHPIDHFKYLNDQGDTSNFNPGKSAYNLYDDKKKVNKNPYLTDYTLDYKNGHYVTDAPQGNDKVAALGSSKGAGLSTLGLYNYLNTNADGSGITYTTPLSFMNASTVNQHEAIGFVGRGFLFISTYLLMLVLMTASAMVMLFAVTIVLEGALSGIPNLLVYATEMATLHWQGFLGIIREAVVMYAKLLLANVIVSLFTETVMRVFNEIDNLLLSGPHALFGSTLAPQLMPFGVSSNVLALVRLLESVAIALLVFEMMIHYRKALKVIQTVLNNIFRKIGGTRHVGSPNAGKNSMRNNSKNGFRNPQNGGNGADGKDGDGAIAPDDPYAEDGNFADRLKQEEDDQDSDPDASNPGIKDRWKRGLAGMAAEGLDKLDSTPVGQMAKTLATHAMTTLGGSKLGEKLGLEGRGDGAEKTEKLEKMAKQAVEGMVNPKNVHNSAKDTQTKAEQEHAKDAKMLNEHAAADQTYNESQQHLADAQKRAQDQQKLENTLDRQLDQNGQIKNPEKANDVLNATKNGLDQIANSRDRRVTPIDKQHAREISDKLGKAQAGYAKKAQNVVAARKQNKANAKKQYMQAKAKQLEARRNKQHADNHVANLKQLAAQGNEGAEKVLPEAEQNQQLADDNLVKADKAVDKAKDNLDKATITDSPSLAGELENASGRNLGTNGENLVKASASERQAAKDKLFTAKTGLKADSNFKATPEIMNKARNAQKQALETLNDPDSTKQQKDEAREIMKAADVVTSTGYQYKQFSQTGQTPVYQKASKQDKQAATSEMGELQSIADTGYTVSNSAPEMNILQKASNNQIARANQIVRTGTYTNSQGQHINATPMQITQARALTQNGLENQTQAVQAQMINTTTHVLQTARNTMNQAYPSAIKYVQADAQKKGEQLTQGQIQQRAQQKVLVDTLKQPQYRTQLENAGLITANASDKQFAKQVVEVNRLGQQQKAVMRIAMQPIKAQIERGGFDAPRVNSSRIIEMASQKSTNNLLANNNWVDAAHYGKTTYGTVKNRVNELLKAQTNGNDKIVAKARQRAIRSGISNELLSNVHKQRSVLDQIEHTQINIKNQAMQRQQQMTAQMS